MTKITFSFIFLRTISKSLIIFCCSVRPYIDGDPVEKKYSILHDNVTFTCDVSGLPGPNVTWTKNDAVLSVSDMEKYEQRVQGDKYLQA